MLAVAESLHDCRSVIVTGKTAARLRGACVRVLELELWVPWRQPIEEIRAWLVDARIRESDALNDQALREGVRLEYGFYGEIAVMLRRTAQFNGYLARSTPLDIRQADGPEPAMVNVAGPDDCCVGWHPRDRDHLALQRAVRLTGQTI